MQPPRGQAFGNFMAQTSDQFEPAARQVLCQKRHQPRRQIIVKIINHTKVQRRQMRQIHHGQFVLRKPQFAQHRLCAPKVTDPRWGQLHGSAPMVDQVRAKGGFEVAHLLADGGLAEPRDLGRLGHRSRCGQGLKDLKPAQGHSFDQHGVFLAHTVLRPSLTLYL